MQTQNGDNNEQLNPRQPQLKVGSQLSIRALVKLGKIVPDDVSVELYSGPVDNWENIRNGSAITMNYEQNAEQEGEHWFTGSMQCKTTGQHGVAVRILPKHTDLVNPYEMSLILWESSN
jgi:starch phosphorylase